MNSMKMESAAFPTIVDKLVGSFKIFVLFSKAYIQKNEMKIFEEIMKVTFLEFFDIVHYRPFHVYENNSLS